MRPFPGLWLDVDSRGPDVDSRGPDVDSRGPPDVDSRDLLPQWTTWNQVDAVRDDPTQETFSG